MSLIYQIKLKNLFAAHQTVYTKLLANDFSSDGQKTHLKKLLNLYQQEIKRLLNKKNVVHYSKRKSNRNGSSYFSFDKKNGLVGAKKDKQQKQSFVKFSTKDATKKFFIKKSSDCLGVMDQLRVMAASDGQFSITNQIDQLRYIGKEDNRNDQQDNNNNNNNDNNVVDVDQDVEQQPETENHNNVKQVHCGGHGKSLSEKNEFVKILDLVHKNDYHKLLNCKKSRKRRTTANPQFSHAAIEAKRITKLEIANERRHRKQVASLEKQNTNNSKTFNENSSESNNEIDNVRSRNVFAIENELFPGLFIIMNESYIEQSCKICSESCRIVSDTIVVCQNCSSIFHINCLEHKFIFSDFIKCLQCNPSLEQERFVAYDDLAQKLNNMRQYISLLANANYCLKLLSEEKDHKKQKLCTDMMELSDNLNRIKNMLQILKTKPGELIDECDGENGSKPVEKINLKENFIGKTSEDIDDAEQTLSQTNSTIGSSSSLMDEYESDHISNGLASATTSVSIGKGDCEQEFPIVSSCA